MNHFKGEKWAWRTPSDFGIITIERRDTQDYAKFYPQKIPLTKQIHLEMSEMHVCSTRWEQLNS